MPDDQDNVATGGIDDTDNEAEFTNTDLPPAGGDGLFRPEQQPHVAEDGATPATPASDVPPTSQGHVPADHPVFDSETNMDAHELYDAGTVTATGADAQHAEQQPNNEIGRDPAGSNDGSEQIA